MMRLARLVAALPLLLTGCVAGSASDQRTSGESASAVAGDARAVDAIAERYVTLTLEAGTHEAEYVDAYYGPPALRDAAAANSRAVPALIAEAQALIALIDDRMIDRSSGMDQRRLIALKGMLHAAVTRLNMIAGKRYSFADEAEGLFSVRPVLKPLAHYDAVLARLDGLVPGDGPLADRVDAFNDRYLIPKDRLKTVFDAAIAECRRRTATYMALPDGERFDMAFVTGKPWSGYNYYQGGYHSRIEINTDLPIRISRAVDLGCHEGYPGHHVLNLIIEQKLVREKGWREYEVNPLYSPQSVISEGSANYGIDLAFPGEERLTFERDVLYPLAGLNPATARRYWEVQNATEALSGARLTIAQMYLDGQIDRATALAHARKYQLLSPRRAEQTVGFTDHYRSYVINYGIGKDMVRAAIEAGSPDRATRWARMIAILSEPTQPADLQDMVGR